MDDVAYMRRALEEACRAAEKDEVPVGAVLVHRETGEIASTGHNLTIANHDPSAHAELVVIRDLCRALGRQRIPDYDLYVTLEPCTMCTAAISFARIGRVVIGAPDPKGGGVLHGAKFYEQPTCHHKPEVTHGILAQECGDVLKRFFKAKR